jgi:hypothetical protein
MKPSIDNFRAKSHRRSAMSGTQHTQSSLNTGLWNSGSAAPWNKRDLINGGLISLSALLLLEKLKATLDTKKSMRAMQRSMQVDEAASEGPYENPNPFSPYPPRPPRKPPLPEILELGVLGVLLGVLAWQATPEPLAGIAAAQEAIP